MFQNNEAFTRRHYSNEEFVKFSPYNQINLNRNPYQNGSFLSTDCSSICSIDGVFSSNTSEKDSPIAKNQVEQGSYRIKYKTEICKYWREKGWCEFGDNCAFAHGTHEIREKMHVPCNYKTKKCKKFHEVGYCPYGARCQFLHSGNHKSQTKSKVVVNVVAKNNLDFLNNIQEFWDKEQKTFLWLYQPKTRLDVFQNISKENCEKKEEKKLDISDLLFIN